MAALFHHTFIKGAVIPDFPVYPDFPGASKAGAVSQPLCRAASGKLIAIIEYCIFLQLCAKSHPKLPVHRAGVGGRAAHGGFWGDSGVSCTEKMNILLFPCAAEGCNCSSFSWRLRERKTGLCLIRGRGEAENPLFIFQVS